MSSSRSSAQPGKNCICLFLFFLLASCDAGVPPKTAPDASLAPGTTPKAWNLPPAWTQTQTRERGIEGMIIPSATATASPTFTYVPKQRTPKPTQRPTETPLPTQVVRTFNAAEDTLVTLVRDNWIYAVNWAGEIMPLWNLAVDDLVNADVLQMEISPDRNYLAFAGIGADGRPSLEVLDLASLDILLRETFDGDRVTDFAWSPDSSRIAAAIIQRQTNRVFTSRIFRVDLAGGRTEIPLPAAKTIAVSQIEWPLPDRMAYVDFSCDNASKETIGYGDPILCGKTGIGMIHLTSTSFFHREITATYIWPGGEFTISPDTSRFLYFSFAGNPGNTPLNALFAFDTLAPVPCSYCGEYYRMIWFEDIILADHPWYGLPDGNADWIDTSSGTVQRLFDYGVWGPNWRSFSYNGEIVLLDYDSYYQYVFAADITPCLGTDWNLQECRKPLWSVDGQWPDSYQAGLWNMEIDCREPEE